MYVCYLSVIYSWCPQVVFRFPMSHWRLLLFFPYLYCSAWWNAFWRSFRRVTYPWLIRSMMYDRRDHHSYGVCTSAWATESHPRVTPVVWRISPPNRSSTTGFKYIWRCVDFVVKIKVRIKDIFCCIVNIFLSCATGKKPARTPNKTTNNKQKRRNK